MYAKTKSVRVEYCLSLSMRLDTYLLSLSLFLSLSLPPYRVQYHCSISPITRPLNLPHSPPTKYVCNVASSRCCVFKYMDISVLLSYELRLCAGAFAALVSLMKDFGDGIGWGEWLMWIG